MDSAFLEAGSAHEGDLIRLGVHWDLANRTFGKDMLGLNLLLEVDAGSWRPELDDDGLFEIGVTPVLRLQHRQIQSRYLKPFLEAAVGVHLLSNVRFGGLNLSTSLQFGSHIGIGVSIGRHQRISLAYRFQHLSNASIKQPNPGIEFHLVQLGYRFTPGR